MIISYIRSVFYDKKAVSAKQPLQTSDFGLLTPQSQIPLNL